MIRMALFRAACLLGAVVFFGLTASAQQLDTELFPAGRPLAKPSAVAPPPPDSGLSLPTLPEGKPLSASVTKTLYLPPAMYGQWSVVATLMEANADFFSPLINEVWILTRDGDQVVVENPANGARAAVSVDRVDGDTAVFHRAIPVGRNRIYLENPTITVRGDILQGTNINRVRHIKDGRVVREYYSVYRLEARRIGAARVQFRPEEGVGGPQIEIDEVQRGGLR